MLEANEPSVIVGVVLWEGKNRKSVQRIQNGIKAGNIPSFSNEPLVDHNPIRGLHIFGYVYERGAIYKDNGPGPTKDPKFVVHEGRPTLPTSTKKEWVRAAKRAIKTTGATATARKVDVNFRSFFNI